MSKQPAFQLYAADFYMDTLTWETDDIGVYFCLLMAEWVNGPLENDTKKLAKIAKKTHQKFLKNWSKISHKFLLNPDQKFINLRLEETRIKQEGFSNSRIKGGKKTAEKRWGAKEGDSSAISSANSSANSSRIGLQSSSSLDINLQLIPKIESSYEDSSPEVPRAPSEETPKAAPEIFITIPLVDKSEFPVEVAMIEEWKNLYPKVDIEQELRSIRGWNISHPRERKTKTGILKHINSWLTKEQNKGVKNGNGNGRQCYPTTGAITPPGTAGLAKSDDQPWPCDATY